MVPQRARRSSSKTAIPSTRSVSYGLWRYGLYSYGLYGYGLYSYGRCSYGTHPPTRPTPLPGAWRGVACRGVPWRAVPCHVSVRALRASRASRALRAVRAMHCARAVQITAAGENGDVSISMILVPPGGHKIEVAILNTQVHTGTHARTHARAHAPTHRTSLWRRRARSISRSAVRPHAIVSSARAYATGA